MRKINNLKIIFLIFKNTYRFSALGNFAKSNKYNKYLLISLSGRVLSILGKFLYFLKLGKFISLDGEPYLSDEKISANIHFKGTSLKIPKEYVKEKNNFVNISNPVLYNEKKFFQIYPIIKKITKMNKNPKIIFMGKFSYAPKRNSILDTKNLNSKKNLLLDNFKLVDDNKYWDRNIFSNNMIAKFDNYKILKTFLREKILLEINKEFKKYLEVYGETKQKINLNFIQPIHKINEINKIYKGNLCLDTGSILGSVSLHPRSLNIIESGGLLIQAHQFDAHKIWNRNYKNYIANNIERMKELIDLYLTNHGSSNDALQELYKQFKNSQIQNEKSLKKLFKNYE